MKRFVFSTFAMAATANAAHADSFDRLLRDFGGAFGNAGAFTPWLIGAAVVLVIYMALTASSA
jgi:uncharacterized membrane protein YeaQ/YmgE (transglycosylase-associated protein family)